VNWVCECNAQLPVVNRAGRTEELSFLRKTRRSFNDRKKVYMGLTRVHDGPGYEDGPFLYYVGGRTAFGIMQAKEAHISEKFSQWRPGLHHLCFRVRSVEDLHKIFSFVVPLLEKHGGKVIRGPEEGPWAPGYTSILIEDRDGIRIEWNYVPGKGLLGTQDKKVFAKL